MVSSLNVLFFFVLAQKLSERSQHASDRDNDNLLTDHILTSDSKQSIKSSRKPKLEVNLNFNEGKKLIKPETDFECFITIKKQVH